VTDARVIKSVGATLDVMFGAQVGPMELFIVLAIVLIIFGPKRLPGLGKQLGRGMREFKESISGDDKDAGDDDETPALTQSTATEPEPVKTEPVPAERPDRSSA
jgi:sec-independent protein translocase protein TatA